MEILEILNIFGKASSNYGSLAATLLSAVVIFIFKEYVRKPKNFSGTFFIKTKTSKTEYIPFEGLTLFHTINVISDGAIVTGHSEKTGEISSSGDIDYIGKNRTPGIITGRVERNYLRKSTLHIIMEEQGKDRKYSTAIHIPISKIMRGNFFSTAADSSGKVEWKDEKFLEHPSKSSPRQFT